MGTTPPHNHHHHWQDGHSPTSLALPLGHCNQHQILGNPLSPEIPITLNNNRELFSREYLQHSGSFSSQKRAFYVEEKKQHCTFTASFCRQYLNILWNQYQTLDSSYTTCKIHGDKYFCETNPWRYYQKTCWSICYMFFGENQDETVSTKLQWILDSKKTATSTIATIPLDLRKRKIDKSLNENFQTQRSENYSGINILDIQFFFQCTLLIFWQKFYNWICNVM